MSAFQEIPKPKGKGRMSTNEILAGSIIAPIDRMRNLSEDDFEDFVLEWVDGYLEKKYSKIRCYGGAGDKGRDIVAYFENGEMDLYQCKHYSTPLSPSQYWIEFGKLIYYTFNKDYPIPQSYFIVTSRGLGPDLSDMIADKAKINKGLLENWEDKCKTKIKKGAIELTKELRKYITNFDFSIVKDKSPMELVNEHKQTVHYASRFGGGLIKYRDLIPTPLDAIQAHELNYTGLLFDAYSKKVQRSIQTKEDLDTVPDLLTHFEEERASFYCAESLEKFSRDNFADLVKLPFEEMKEDALAVLKSCLRLSSRIEDLDRLEESKLTMMTQQFSGNPLHREIRQLDKSGICHYLANEKKVKWEK